MSSPFVHAITCSKCGAALDPESGAQILVCSYCQTSHVFTPPPAGATPTAASRKFPVLPLVIAGTVLVVLSGAALAALRGAAPPSALHTPPGDPAEPAKRAEASAGDPLATYGVGQAVDIYWGSRWWPGRVLKKDDGRYRITYDGWSASWDEWVGPDRLRTRGAQH